MSFIQTPSKIINSLRVIVEATNERAAVAGGVGDIDYVNLRLPYSRNNISWAMTTIRGTILQLYGQSFPPSNFGKFGWYTPLIKNNKEVDNKSSEEAVAEELAANNIDPNAFLMTPPFRYSNPQFLWACYHLLNNCILYFFPKKNTSSDYLRTIGITKEIIYRSNGSSYSNEIAFDDKGWFVTLANGWSGGGGVKEKMSYDTEAHFHFKGNRVLRGEWQMRLHSEASSQYYTDDVLEGNHSWSETFKHIVNFNGMESENVIPTFPSEIKEKAELLQSWGGGSYRSPNGSVSSTRLGNGGETARLLNHEVKLTKENFPPLNYKYLDE